VLRRIRALGIPPAWKDVWICTDPRGRKQYRYHRDWRATRDGTKVGRMEAFAAALPAIRKRTTADLARPGLPREKVLATVVQFLEKSLIRVGNEEYARTNKSYGLTTMRDNHVFQWVDWQRVPAHGPPREPSRRGSRGGELVEKSG